MAKKKTKKDKKNKINIKRIVIKLLLSLIYLSIIGVLVYSAFMIFTEEKKIVKWTEVEKTDQYTYLEIDQMSEAFAKIDDKQIHFIMDKESTGAWHTYLIAINEKDYDKYKTVIDYTYERVKEKPETIKVYGYPVKITKDIKTLAIKNITKFVPVENEIQIKEDNFEKYLTNTYLDTTIEKQEEFNYYVLVLLLGALVIFIVFIYTIFEKDKTIKKEPEKKTVKKKKETSKDKKELKEETKKDTKKKSKKDTKKQEKNSKKKETKKNIEKEEKTTNETKKNDQNKSTTKKKEDVEVI
ncbi:MAG: hypothetical protein J6A17_04760 [Bacilli bacterium]|nr:hypothetical protein [Bacilli bacterium]